MATKITKKQTSGYNEHLTIQMVDISTSGSLCNNIENNHVDMNIIVIDNRMYAEIYGQKTYLCDTKINIIKSWYYEEGRLQVSGF